MAVRTRQLAACSCDVAVLLLAPEWLPPAGGFRITQDYLDELAMLPQQMIMEIPRDDGWESDTVRPSKNQWLPLQLLCHA